jgi:hypothetical protein
MLPELKVKIGAETVDLEKSLDKVEKRLGGFERTTQAAGKGLQDFGQSTQNLGKRMLPLSAGVTAAATGMFLLAKNTANAGDEIAKSARGAGVSADALQELRFALGQAAGVGEQQTSSMLATLTRRMGEAVAGNDNYTSALENLGISLEDVASGAVTTDEVFNSLAAAMQNAGSDAEAAAISSELLGRSNADLGPKLRAAEADIGALRDRAQELGIVLGGDALNASEAFNDKMDELSKQTTAARQQIGQSLLPVALALATAFQERVVPAIVSVADGVAQAIEWFGQLSPGVQEAAGIIATAFAVGGPALMAIGATLKILGSLALLFTPAGAIIGGLIAVAAAWAKWGDDIKEFTTQAVDWVIETFGQVVTFFEELPARFMEFGRNIITGLWDGLKSAWEEFDILGTIGGWASSIGNRFKGALGIESPSKVFHEFGMNIGEGLRNGINDSFGMVRSAVQGLGDVVTSGAFDMAKGVVDAMGQMFQGSKPIAAAQALINTFQGITEALKLPFPASLAAAARVAAQGFAAVRGIQSARPGSSGGASAGAAGGSGASGGSTQQQAQAPTTTFQFTLQNDSFGFGENFARQLVDQLNEASRNGGQVRGVIA